MLSVVNLITHDIEVPQIINTDALSRELTSLRASDKVDIIVANPPYAKMLENGKRASKNHNLIKDFIEKALSQMMQIEPQPEKKIKLFHTLTFAEIVDNLANSTVILFKQIYSFDVNGLMTSYDNYIYYGIIFIFIYIILRMVWQELEN
jgi:type I restriction-modification system DNA methylase subunit